MYLEKQGGLPGGPVVGAPSCNVGDLNLIPDQVDPMCHRVTKPALSLRSRSFCATATEACVPRA